MLTTTQPHRQPCPICDARPGRQRPWTFTACAECGREGCPGCVGDFFDGCNLCRDCREARRAAENAVRFPVVPGLRTTPEDGEAWWVEMSDGEVWIAHAYRLDGLLMLSVHEEHGPVDVSWDNVHIARYLGPVNREPAPFPAADTGATGGSDS